MTGTTTTTEAPTAEQAQLAPVRTATVTLFKPSGKYYTQEAWRVPEGAYGPQQMAESPDFRRIDGGAVLVDSEAAPECPDARNFGVPHLFPAAAAS